MIKEGTRTLLAIVLLFAGVSYYFISQTLKGKMKPYLRRIAGLDAIEEAVGRATEMGRPIHFSPGIGGFGSATFAALSVLEHATELSARYNTELIVSVRVATVFPVAQEMVRQAYLTAGKPDMFKEDTVRFLSGEQFAYAAGAMGILHRYQCAANIMMGDFLAESMLLAEAGAQVGAMQVAGTANLGQIAFFVAACDYTLIGEELYVAGAYLSQDPQRLGSIAGQEYIKMFVMAYLVLGSILATGGINFLQELLSK